jgi:hypothetical protein
MCSHTTYTPQQSMPTNNNKKCQIENCVGNKLRCVSNVLLMYFINAPTSKWHNVSCSWFIEFEGLEAWREGETERERERERVCVCVCNVHMISTKSFHIPTFVCFTTVDIPGIPSHYTHHPCTRFHMLGHTVKLEELQPLHTVNTTSKDLLLMVLLP